MGNLYCWEDLIYVWECGLIDPRSSFLWPRLAVRCPPEGKQVSSSLLMPVVESLRATATRVSLHSKYIRVKPVLPTLQSHIHFHTKANAPDIDTFAPFLYLSCSYNWFDFSGNSCRSFRHHICVRIPGMLTEEPLIGGGVKQGFVMWPA